MSKNNITTLFSNPEDRELTNSEIMYKKMEIDTLARTIWGEARGETIVGMQAVANVIMNRHKVSRKLKSYWWGNDIIQICQKPYQFSCWNRSDPNYRKLMKIDEKNIQFQASTKIAKRSMAGTLNDVTKGATHYHAIGITPFWSENETPTVTIGNHIFYKLIEV